MEIEAKDASTRFDDTWAGVSAQYNFDGFLKKGENIEVARAIC